MKPCSVCVLEWVCKLLFLWDHKCHYRDWVHKNKLPCQHGNYHYKDKMILSCNMMKCFKDYKICIHISYHIMDFIQQRETKFTMEQLNMLPIIYCQYHACWCPKDLRSQGISRHDIDQINRNILSLALEELTLSHDSSSGQSAMLSSCFWLWNTLKQHNHNLHTHN